MPCCCSNSVAVAENVRIFDYTITIKTRVVEIADRECKICKSFKKF